MECYYIDKNPSGKCKPNKKSTSRQCQKHIEYCSQDSNQYHKLCDFFWNITNEEIETMSLEDIERNLKMLEVCLYMRNKHQETCVHPDCVDNGHVQAIKKLEREMIKIKNKKYRTEHVDPLFKKFLEMGIESIDEEPLTKKENPELELKLKEPNQTYYDYLKKLSKDKNYILSVEEGKVEPFIGSVFVHLIISSGEQFTGFDEDGDIEKASEEVYYTLGFVKKFEKPIEKEPEIEKVIPEPKKKVDVIPKKIVYKVAKKAKKVYEGLITYLPDLTEKYSTYLKNIGAKIKNASEFYKVSFNEKQFEEKMEKSEKEDFYRMVSNKIVDEFASPEYKKDYYALYDIPRQTIKIAKKIPKKIKKVYEGLITYLPDLTEKYSTYLSNIGAKLTNTPEFHHVEFNGIEFKEKTGKKGGKEEFYRMVANELVDRFASPEYKKDYYAL